MSLYLHMRVNGFAPVAGISADFTTLTDGVRDKVLALLGQGSER